MNNSELLQEYLATHAGNGGFSDLDPGEVAFIANLSSVARVSSKVAGSIVKELADQRSNLKLIASENYSSLATQAAMGNLLTDKYAEGVPYHRFYAGCDNIDEVESLACELACDLFGADHAYVQPHSGADANLIAYWAILSKRVKTPALEELGEGNPAKLDRKQWNELRRLLGNQKLLAMDYGAGGHLTHGYRHNISAQLFDAYLYGVDDESGLIDYDKLMKQAVEVRPLILLAGYSAYPRAIDFRKMREIADEVDATLMVDMAHFAGLVAGKQFQDDYDPVAFADVVTSTTHKTLRGPRGGIILCTEEYAEHVDKGCPMVMGGPLPNLIAAKAVALREAGSPEFRDYASRIVENSRALSEAFVRLGAAVVSGGSDNHLLLVDTRPFGVTGRQAESALRECSITLNRNALQNDPNGPWYTSGLRIGTPAVTTLGMGSTEMEEIAGVMYDVLDDIEPRKARNNGKMSKARYRLSDDVRRSARERIESLLDRFPVYPEIDLELIRGYFDREVSFAQS